MKYLVIMQGASGSGKSTLAKILASVLDAQIRSTDDLFVDEDGVYCFDPLKVGEMHQENFLLAWRNMLLGENVIIDNTNIQCWQAREYVRTGVALGYTIKFVRCTGDYPNAHGVPDETIKQMREQMEELTIQGCLDSLCPWEKPVS